MNNKSPDLLEKGFKYNTQNEYYMCQKAFYNGSMFFSGGFWCRLDYRPL